MQDSQMIAEQQAEDMLVCIMEELWRRTKMVPYDWWSGEVRGSAIKIWAWFAVRRIGANLGSR